MIRLLFVGDGARDKAILPPIVRGVLDEETTGEFRSWKSLRLHGTGRRKRKGSPSRTRGYGRKLKYARGVAMDKNLIGLVAIADADRETRRPRLRELSRAREEERTAGHDLPIAIGEAKPHTEAWLLDDAQAVRLALSLGEEVEVPSVKNLPDPKGALEALLKASSRGDEPKIVWADIAGRLERNRCANAKQTGFAAFVKDVQAELRSVPEV